MASSIYDRSYMHNALCARALSSDKCKVTRNVDRFDSVRLQFHRLHGSACLMEVTRELGMCNLASATFGYLLQNFIMEGGYTLHDR